MTSRSAQAHLAAREGRDLNMSIAAPVAAPVAAPPGPFGSDVEATVGQDPGEIVVTFVHPVIGLGRSTRYAIRPLGASWDPYVALVSLDEAGLAFMIVPPAALFSDYVIEIPDDDVALLGLESGEDAVVFVIVRRRGVPTPVVNLVAPVIVNRRTLAAAQVVLQDSGYGLMVPVDAGSARPELPAR